MTNKIEAKAIDNLMFLSVEQSTMQSQDIRIALGAAP